MTSVAPSDFAYNERTGFFDIVVENIAKNPINER